MKKAIISTISSVLGVSALATTAIFLPAYVATQGYNFSFFDYKQALTNSEQKLDQTTLSAKYMSTTNVGLNELIFGSKLINNGNYILYIGSEGYANHRSFLYGSSVSSTNELMANLNPTIDSTFGIGLKYLLSSDFARFNKVNNNLPVITYIDKIQYSDVLARFNYEKTIEEYKKLPINKNAEDAKGLSEKQLKENKKKYDWAQNPPEFNIAPGATYEDWNSKTQYFRDSYESGNKFNKIVDFVSRTFGNLSDITSSSGIIIGIRNGQLAELYSGSFSAQTTTPDNGSENKSFVSRSVNPFLSTYTYMENNILPSTNNFSSWISRVFTN